VETLLKHGSDPSIHFFHDMGFRTWPTTWEYATDELHDRTEEEWQAHERIVAMFEALRPTPYYTQPQTVSDQPQESQLAAESTVSDLDYYEEIQHHATENPLLLKLTPKESEYIESSSNPILARLCHYLALAYNAHEPRWILEHCAPDVEYTSQSVFQTLSGIREYGDYLTDKLRTLSQQPDSQQACFELGYSHAGKPCVIGYQRQGMHSSGIGERLLWMDIEYDEQGRFLKICAVTCVPPPSIASGTGIFPGIEATL
jgi:hypothetical protein